MTPDWLTTLAFGMGAAWLSGLNLYAAVVTLGLLEHFHLAQLPGDLNMLGQWWVIGLAGVLYLIQFAADKVPAVDSVWDAIHTFIRVPAGAVLAAGAFAHFDPAVRLAALLAGGTIALSSHGTKSATRLMANASPEPVSNILLSLSEDAVSVGSSVLLAFHPLVILGVVAVFLAMVGWMAPKLIRRVRAMFRPRAQRTSTS